MGRGELDGPTSGTQVSAQNAGVPSPLRRGWELSVRAWEAWVAVATHLAWLGFVSPSVKWGRFWGAGFDNININTEAGAVAAEDALLRAEQRGLFACQPLHPITAHSPTMPDPTAALTPHSLVVPPCLLLPACPRAWLPVNVLFVSGKERPR